MRRSPVTASVLVVPAVLLAVLLAGCVGGPSPSAGSPSTGTPSASSATSSPLEIATGSPTATATSSPTVTDASSPTATVTSSPTTPPVAACPGTAESTNVSIPAWPDRPDSFDRESALAFAAQFERAYVTRRTIADSSENYVRIWVNAVATDDATNVTRVDDGWQVHFDVIGPATRWRPNPTSTETRHADPPLYEVSYLLVDDRVIRQRTYETVDPRENGVAIRCPPA